MTVVKRCQFSYRAFRLRPRQHVQWRIGRGLSFRPVLTAEMYSEKIPNSGHDLTAHKRLGLRSSAVKTTTIIYCDDFVFNLLTVTGASTAAWTKRRKHVHSPVLSSPFMRQTSRP